MAALSEPLRFLLFFFLLCDSPVYAGKCHKGDKKVLLSIKNSIGDYIFTGWTSDFACCDWSGVGCDEVSNPSTRTPAWSAPSPPAIGRLTFLRLDWNSLSGPVPAFLAALRRLEYLNLGFNQLSGAIPPSLSTLPLDFLAIDRNRLTGPIPDSLGRSSLIYLYLSHNNLTGQVPASFAGNTVAEVVDLSRNQLSGDASALFGKGKPLWRLDLSRNHEIEFDLGKVEIPEKIVALDLNHNKVFGRLPPEMGKIQWQLLNVSYNRLCGRIPSGERIESMDQYSFLHNDCLCGPPLPPCK
ncbi:polygalacturonase inhibitor-like [Zingiber officinale]|uniref:polygalacturonase inhibitor-like n=1 Tax=Zingiber officinale TaxID=94328 RepID=UPI001C4BD7B2|nr:polygalacturonase inhibitor-like [Zingiber officinale]